MSIFFEDWCEFIAHALNETLAGDVGNSSLLHLGQYQGLIA
jgi:hypothetical protein